MAVSAPKCLQNLLEMLAEDVPGNQQGIALLVIGRISAHDVDLNPSLYGVAMVSTDLELVSICNGIEKLMDKMNTICPGYRALLYSIWCFRNATRKAYPAALDYINKALELEPMNDLFWRERGILHRIMGNYEGALEDLARALQMDIDNYEYLKHRAFVKFEMGDEEGASGDAERAMSVKPSRVDENLLGNSDGRAARFGFPFLGALPVKFGTYELK